MSSQVAGRQRILGELRPSHGSGVQFHDHGDRLELRAHANLHDAASGHFAQPTHGAVFATSDFNAPEVALVGFAYTQFALPVRAAPGRGFDFEPAHNLRSPPAVMPLLLSSSDGRVELLAPLDSWHEQVIAVEQSEIDGRYHIDRLVWGWHGDLDEIPAGFTTTLGIFTATSASEAFEQWGAAVRSNAQTQRPPADADPLLTHLSYWTDNGAAYWYRTEPGRDITRTLHDKVRELDDLGAPVRSVELDSWFYPHETTRSVSETGYLEDVPPTGMLSWTPRPDVLPDGLLPLRSSIGDRPLVLHSRHISPQSPYLESGDWWVDRAAHPADPAFFERWCRDAASWGATVIEQDWMMVSFFGVRELRARPGRVADWQRGLDRAASKHDLYLMWCMALPGDFAASCELERVVAIRTCDDYRFADDPADLWIWYLTVNVMASALALPVFKDCFFSSAGPGSTDDSSDVDGDPHAELESVLSALSAGVVGIGDRIGCTDMDVIRRICRPDGRLVGPDCPITLTDVSMTGAGIDQGLCWASTHSTNELGTWRYLLAINTSADSMTRSDRFVLPERSLVYAWREGQAEPLDAVEVTLDARDWALFVCCPLPSEGGPDDATLIGDPGVYATMSKTRVDVTGGAPSVITAAGEASRPLLWWSPSHGLNL